MSSVHCSKKLMINKAHDFRYPQNFKPSHRIFYLPQNFYNSVSSVETDKTKIDCCHTFWHAFVDQLSKVKRL